MPNYLKSGVICAYVAIFILSSTNLINPSLVLIVFTLDFIIAISLIAVCVKQRNVYDINSVRLFNLTRLLVNILMYQVLILVMGIVSFWVYTIMKCYGVLDANLDMFNLIVGKLSLLSFMILNTWGIIRSLNDLNQYLRLSEEGC